MAQLRLYHVKGAIPLLALVVKEPCQNAVTFLTYHQFLWLRNLQQDQAHLIHHRHHHQPNHFLMSPLMVDGDG